MYKNFILTFFFIISFHFWSVSQSERPKSKDSNIRLEFLGTYSHSYKGKGFLFKAKKETLNTKRINIYSGFALQFSSQNESNLVLSRGVDGGNSNMGLYAICNLDYHPFKNRRFFLGLEPFMGVTYLRTMGSLTIPKHQVYESFSNDYVYFNYGITPSAGYNFGRVRVAAFSMASFKGVLDNGRTRPGDMDSRIFVGLLFGYNLHSTD